MCYPYYFEGLVCYLQGDEDAAGKCWTLSAAYGRFPEAGMDLTALGDMATDELYELRDSLRTVENAITERYTAPRFPIARNPLNGSVEYLLTVAQSYIAAEDYETALDYCLAAVNADPYDDSTFAGAALVYMSLEEFDRAAWYISEGLLIAPEHEGLTALESMYGEEP